MVRLIIWAMATGFITGAVWFAIHFLRRGGSVPLALRGDRNHEALAPGVAHGIHGYQPIALADQDSRNLHVEVEAPTRAALPRAHTPRAND